MGVLRMGALSIGVPIKGILSNKKIFSIRNFSLKIGSCVINNINNTSLVYTSYISSLYFLAN